MSVIFSKIGKCSFWYLELDSAWYLELELFLKIFVQNLSPLTTKNTNKSSNTAIKSLNKNLKRMNMIERAHEIANVQKASNN